MKFKSAGPISGSRESKTSNSFPIVGIGASAGGLEAVTRLLQQLPVDTGMGFVLVQHLDPDHPSALPEILTRATNMPVRQAADNLPVAPDSVYIIPPNVSMAISAGKLQLGPRQSHGRLRAIDFFFESLAQDRGAQAIGVILSGTATDGTLGLEAIKAEGGITFAQDDSAKYNSMPRSAEAAGCVDLVLSPENIAKELARIARHPHVSGELEEAATLQEAEAQAGDAQAPEAALPAHEGQAPGPAQRGARPGKGDSFKKILLLLRNHCGVDFSLYKPSTIHRRISRRMALNRKTSLGAYADSLRENRKELEALTRTCSSASPVFSATRKRSTRSRRTYSPI